MLASIEILFCLLSRLINRGMFICCTNCVPFMKFVLLTVLSGWLVCWLAVSSLHIQSPTPSSGQIPSLSQSPCHQSIQRASPSSCPSGQAPLLLVPLPAL